MPKLFPSKLDIQAKHSLVIVYSFFALFLTNIIILWLAHTLFPTQIVLGTYAISPGWAIYHSMLKLTTIGLLAMQLLTIYQWKQKITFGSQQLMLIHFAINSAALWEITRFATQLGFGISSWIVILLLSLVVTAAQRAAMMILGKAVK